jgi:hypothetical protein
LSSGEIDHTLQHLIYDDRLAAYFGLSVPSEGGSEMGSVYRKAVTKPLPADAEIITRKGERLARWRDGKG